MPAPLVGITSYAREGGELPVFSLPTGYVDALRRAGAVPVVLPAGEDDPRSILPRLDGLVFSGGGDVAPSRYGGTMHETVYAVSEERDRFEFSLLRAALASWPGPLLCICRGMQVLNVVCGGTLHVHLPERLGNEVPHRVPPRQTCRHSVRLDSTSRLAALLGSNELSVCSWHHQGIDALGKELRAVGWAADGLVEAVEHTRHPWCIGVQWHPEMDADDPCQQALFRGFVDAAKNWRNESKQWQDD